MIETPPDTIEEFLRLPVALESDDPRFVVRRIPPAEYERVYACVDEAFGRVRPRDHYDWMYRRNPYGHARIWGVEEVATGRLLKTGAFFPWPIWRGGEAIRGSMAGDVATVPDWQRQGLTRIRRIVRRSHPWAGTICTIAGPNEGSRIVTRKAGEAETMLGALPGGVLVLRGAGVLGRAGLPRLAARPLGRVADGVLALWSRLGLGRVERGVGQGASRFEPVTRFDVAFDAVTERTMSFPGYWSPHNADFLNWRYVDHPVERYVAFALVEHERPVAYSVLRLDGEQATLAEFAAEGLPSRQGPRLLAETIAVARAAGCAWVDFFSTPTWRHWGLFRRAGMLPFRTRNHLDAAYKLDEAGVQDVRRWQLTPGDRDYH
ncbi:MAG: GNAT family N-acetyltransferase [Spirochaetaceae bacterium]|nr:GNAT family N-acetyltransferase [Spirochaetaceae bacterium]